MRLQHDDDVVLYAELGRIIGAARMDDVLLFADEQRQAALAHRGQVSAARDQADIGASARKLHAEISADRAGAVDADFHEILAGVAEFWDEDPVRLGGVRAGGGCRRGRLLPL